jgi:hypothetical protein
MRRRGPLPDDATARARFAAFGGTPGHLDPEHDTVSVRAEVARRAPAVCGSGARVHKAAAAVLDPPRRPG